MAAARRKELEAEKARRAAEAAAGEAPSYTDEEIAKKRETPEGLGELLFQAVRWNLTDLLSACWIDEDDAKELAGDKAARYYTLAKRFRNRSWTTLRREHPDARRGAFERVEAEVKELKNGKQVRNGRVVYTLDGEEREMPLAVLIQMRDGSWKALSMTATKKKKKAE
jgi:hypothetical protein